MQTVDIPLLKMIIVYAMILIPLLLLLFFKINFLKNSLVSILRMSIQLTLVGLYLGLIFRINNIYLNFGWVLVMITVATIHILTSASLQIKTFFGISFIGIVTGTLYGAGLLVFLIINPSPIYDARYVIPIFGMVLGNCLRANILSLDRFYSGIKDMKKEYETYLAMGATPYEAASPFLKKAVTAAIKPQMSVMATMGIVSLPGMMTGQLLGGSVPVIAIKYQIAIMLSIISSGMLTSLINILLSMKVSIDSFGIIDENKIFAKRK